MDVYQALKLPNDEREKLLNELEARWRFREQRALNQAKALNWEVIVQDFQNDVFQTTYAVATHGGGMDLIALEELIDLEIEATFAEPPLISQTETSAWTLENLKTHVF